MKDPLKIVSGEILQFNNRKHFQTVTRNSITISDGHLRDPRSITWINWNFDPSIFKSLSFVRNCRQILHSEVDQIYA